MKYMLFILIYDKIENILVQTGQEVHTNNRFWLVKSLLFLSFLTLYLFFQTSYYKLCKFLQKKYTNFSLGYT